MRLLCRFGVHKWGEWGKPFHLAGAKYLNFWQHKECKHCGMVQERKL